MNDLWGATIDTFTFLNFAQLKAGRPFVTLNCRIVPPSLVQQRTLVCFRCPIQIRLKIGYHRHSIDCAYSKETPNWRPTNSAMGL